MKKRLARRHGVHGDHGVFRGWRGLVSKSRVLCGFFFFAFLFSFFSCDGENDEEIPVPWNAAWPLREIYDADDYFLIGNIISPGDLDNAKKVRFDILKYHYNTVTAENHMKPDYIAPYPKPVNDTWAYRFTDADRIVDAARAEGMNVVGHTLIWYSQTPAWLTKDNVGVPLDKATVLSNLKKYVTEVVKHFEGKLISWDVVNEAMKESNEITESAAADWTTCLRPLAQNGWMVIGPEYIEEAFLAARAADPNVKLYYNDYALNYNRNNGYKALAVYNMVKDINERYPKVGGRPLIDGIGMQSHHHLGTDPETVRESIELFASLGVEVAITELDIIAAGSRLSGSPPWDKEAANKQAAKYAAMLRVFIENAEKISRVTFWGIDDGTHWRTLDGSDAHAALLDEDYNLKPAFYAVISPYGY
jgi:endo-1,4-beta-xylanase